MKKILVIALLAFCLNIFADRIDEIISTIPADMSKFADASAINILTEIDLTIEENFTYQYHVFYVKKILNYKGKKRYSDVKIKYSGDYETIELGHCLTIDAEGNRIEIPENQIYDMNDTKSIQSPDYINFREKIINFPHIEPGNYIILDYTITNTRQEPVSGVEHLRESNPYLQKTFTISFPKKMKLNTNYDEILVEYSQHKKGKNKIYQFNVKDAEIYKEENNSPSLLLAGTPIVYSCYKNWQQLAEQKLSKLRNIPLPVDIAETVQTLTETSDTDEDKILAVYKYFAENFSVKASYPSAQNFTPEPLLEVWQKKFGSERELTALFISALNFIGINDVYPAVILSPETRFGDIQTNYAVVDFIDYICVYHKGELYVPGNRYMPFGYAGINEANILVGNDDFDLIKYELAKNPQKTTFYNYKINDNNAVTEIEEIYADSWNFQMRNSYLDWPDAQRKIWFTRQLGEKSATIMADPIFHNYENLEEDLKVTYTLQYENFVVDQQPYKYFKLISPKIRLDVALDARENDYQVEKEIFEKQQFEIYLDDQQIELLNKINEITEFECDNKKAYFRISSKIKGNQILIEKEIFIPEFIVPVERYQEFKQFVLKIKNPINNMVFVK